MITDQSLKHVDKSQLIVFSWSYLHWSALRRERSKATNVTEIDRNTLKLFSLHSLAVH